MPGLYETVANTTRRRLLGGAVGALLLAACGGPESYVHIAANGTKIEAKQVVALVYAQSPDTEIDKVLYSGGELTRVIKRLRDRYPQLKPWLDQGAIGNTASGFVVLREDAQGVPGAQDAPLRDLVRDENRDRTFLYKEASAAVGHGTDNLSRWLPYASSTFGKEWTAQGQPGWWSMNEQQQWGRN